MFSQRLDTKISLFFLFLTSLFILSCDDFQDETYTIDTIDDLGIEAITDKNAAVTIKPMNITWSDSLQVYIGINTGTADTFQVATINAIWDTLIEYGIEVATVEYRIIKAFDAGNTLISVDTVQLASVDSYVTQLESNASVDSINVSVPQPNYFITVGANVNGYSIAYRPQSANKVNIYSDNFVNYRIIEVSSMDSTYLVPSTIPLEAVAGYYTISSNKPPEPYLKSRGSVNLAQKNYIIQVMKTEATINSGRTYLSLVTE